MRMLQLQLANEYPGFRGRYIPKLLDSTFTEATLQANGALSVTQQGIGIVNEIYDWGNVALLFSSIV